MLMNDYRLRTDSLGPGPRRDAIAALDAKIECVERDMNRALEARMFHTCVLARNDLKILREQRAYLFTCSIHTILREIPNVPSH
jgi:hypothetical protein